MIIIVPITKSYLDEGRVLLNSLQITNPKIPVHVLTTDLKEDDFKEFKTVEKVVQSPTCTGMNAEFRQIRTYRFKYAIELGEQHVKQQEAYIDDPHEDFSVLLLDADMCCLRKLDKFFEMAYHTILCCSNNTLLRYIKKDFDHMHVSCNPTIDVTHTTFSSVPIFINPIRFKNYLQEIWNNKTGNDLDVPNLVLSSMNLYDKMYLLNSYAWTNIHHTMIKPETFVKKTFDGLFSNQGEPIYMIHGHWGQQPYLEELIRPMEKNYGYCRKYIEGAANCINIIKAEYDKYKC